MATIEPVDDRPVSTTAVISFVASLVTLGFFVLYSADRFEALFNYLLRPETNTHNAQILGFYAMGLAIPVAVLLGHIGVTGTWQGKKRGRPLVIVALVIGYAILVLFLGQSLVPWYLYLNGLSSTCC